MYNKSSPEQMLYNICSTFIKEFPGINLYNICSISIYLPILVLCSYLPVQIFKKRMLNIIIISLQSVNEWPVFNLKKNILTNILRLLLVRIHCSI